MKKEIFMVSLLFIIFMPMAFPQEENQSNMTIIGELPTYQLISYSIVYWTIGIITFIDIILLLILLKKG